MSMQDLKLTLSPTEILVDTSTELVLTVYTAAGTAATISNASVKIRNYAGTEVVSTTSISPSTNTLKYTVPSTIATTTGANWQAEYTFTISSQVYNYVKLFDVVKYLIACPVITSDIEAVYPQVKGHYPDGSTTWQTQIDTAFTKVKLDLKFFFVQNWLHLMADAGQIRQLVLYQSAMIILASLITNWEQGNAFVQNYYLAKEEYQKALQSGKIFIDADQDNEFDEVITGTRSMQLVR